MSGSVRAVSSVARDTLKTILADTSGFNAFLKKLKVTYEDDGRCVCEMKVEPKHSNRNGTLHGGVASTLIDVVGILAVATSTKPDCKVGVSVNLTVSFHESADVGEDVVIDARTLNVGEQLAFSEVKITSKCNGKLIASGKETKFIGEGAPTLKSCD